MRHLSCIAVVVLSAAIASAQVDWLPPEAEQGAARAMVARFAEAGVEIPGTDEERFQGAVRAIRGISGRIDQWGLDGALERAPQLAEIERPAFEDPIVGAIASYGLCSLPLHPELASTREEKMLVVLGEFSVALVSAFLRDGYLAGGGTDQELERLLASDAMNRLSLDIQRDEAKRNQVMTGCGPMFEAMFGDETAAAPPQ